MHFENGRSDTATAQLAGRGQAGRAAADDGDLLADQRGAGLEFEALGEGDVADVLFDCVDADEILHVVTVAAVLTGSRADAPHHGREGIGVRGAAECVLLHADILRRFFDTAHDIQPAADVFT